MQAIARVLRAFFVFLHRRADIEASFTQIMDLRGQAHGAVGREEHQRRQRATSAEVVERLLAERLEAQFGGNGGHCVHASVLNLCSGDHPSCVLVPMPAIAGVGRLKAFEHDVVSVFAVADVVAMHHRLPFFLGVTNATSPPVMALKRFIASAGFIPLIVTSLPLMSSLNGRKCFRMCGRTASMSCCLGASTANRLE